MKKGLPLGAALCFTFILISSPGTTGPFEKTKPHKFGHWLKEEVSLLITEEEERQFQSLTSDQERERFVEVFWKKRDPTPGTVRNEFKEEWSSRLQYVQANFTHGPKKGWRSDMGKVYMFLGPPTQVRTVKPRKQLEDSGGDMMEPSATIWVKEPYQEWIYQPMPDLGLETSFRVTFRKYGYARETGISLPQDIMPQDPFGFSLDTQTPEDIRRALEIFPRAVIFNSDLESWPQPKYVLDQESIEGKLIYDFVLSGEEIRRIPLELMALYTRGRNGYICLSFLVKVEARQKEKKKFEELIFFCRLKGNDGVEHDFKQPVRPEEMTGGELIGIFGFPIMPGRYILYFGAKGQDRENYTLLKSELDIPDLWNDGLNTSTLILSSEVTSESGPDGTEVFDPYKIGEYRASPRWGNVFKSNEFLNVLFHIYNAHRKNSQISVKVEYFIISDEVGYRLRPQIIERKLEAEITVAAGTQVSLSPLKPGRYTLKVVITDMLTGESIERQSDFFVA